MFVLSLIKVSRHHSLCSDCKWQLALFMYMCSSNKDNYTRILKWVNLHKLRLSYFIILYRNQIGECIDLFIGKKRKKNKNLKEKCFFKVECFGAN